MEPIACPDCDLLQRLPPLASGGTARCVQCGRALARRHDSIDRPLALLAAAAIALLVANTTTLMDVSALGQGSSTTLIGGAVAMWRHGSEVTAAVVALCAVAGPAAQVALFLAVLVAARRTRVPRWVGDWLLGANLLGHVSMADLTLLGLLVAVTKIAQVASIVPGVGIYALGAFVALETAALATLDVREIWRRVPWVDGRTADAQLTLVRDAGVPT